MLSELQMKAKILPFIQRQGMCPGTPMGPSADLLPVCIKPCLPSFQGNSGAWWWMHKEGNGDLTTFSCLSVISYCLRKNHKCTNRKASKVHKMSAHGFIRSHLWWMISGVAQACISEATWLFESFCWYSNEQALFVTFCAFYLVTMMILPNELCARSPLEHVA